MRSGSRVNRNFVKQFPNLKLVCTSTSGFDHLDLRVLEELGIQALYAPDPPVQSVAELTFFLIFGALRKYKKAQNQLKSGAWRRSEIMGGVLSGKTLGLVGCGRIGQKVAQMAHAWGLSVIAYDPYLPKWPSTVQSVGFEELLIAADILSFHVPLTTETRFMLNRSTLEKVSSRLLIINTSRGLVIQEDDLIQFLVENPRAMAGLDVFNSEPLSSHSALQRLSNVFMTPHIGASTEDGLYRSSEEAFLAVEQFFAQGKVNKNTLPPEALWVPKLKGPS